MNLCKFSYEFVYENAYETEFVYENHMGSYKIMCVLFILMIQLGFLRIE